MREGFKESLPSSSAADSELSSGDKSHVSDREISSPQEELAQSQPEGARPKKAGSIWKIYNEQAVTPVEKAKTQERKQWLESLFMGKDSNALRERNDVLDVMRSEIYSPLQAEGASKTDQKRADAYNALFEDDAARTRAIRLLDTIQYAAGRPLMKFFENANNATDLRALRLLSVTLLKPHILKDSPEYRQSLSGRQKEQIRLGELMGMEAERRLIMLNREKGTTPAAEKDKEARMTKLFSRFKDSEDLPDVLKTEMQKTYESLAPKQPEAGQPDAGIRKKDPLSSMVEILRSAESVQDEAALTRAISHVSQKEYDVFRKNEAVVQMQLDLYDENYSYADNYLEFLKNQSHGGISPEMNKYRKNFIDSMYTQIRHSQFVNSDPSLFSRAVRGFAEKLDARTQVLGLRGLIPFWAERKMRAVRAEVIVSFQKAAQRGIDADVAAYHVGKFAMANLHSQRADAAWMRRLAWMGPVKNWISRRAGEVHRDESSGMGRSSQEANPEQSMYTIENARDYAYGTNEEDAQLKAAREYAYGSSTEAQPDYDAQLEAARDYAYGSSEQKQPDQHAQPATIKMEFAKKVFNRLVEWWEGYHSLPTLDALSVHEPELWKEFNGAVKAANTTREKYWQEVGAEVTRRRTATTPPAAAA